MSDKEKKVKVDNLDPRNVKPSEAESLRGGMMPRGDKTTRSSDATDTSSDGLQED
jgi:hypothetical protein